LGEAGKMRRWDLTNAMVRGGGVGEDNLGTGRAGIKRRRK